MDHFNAFPMWARILTGLLILLLLGWLIYRLRSRVESRLSQRGLHPGAGHAVTTIGNYLFWLLGALMILRIAGVDLSLLTVIAGAFSFAVGFGLQTIIQNFVAGIIILLERPIKIGDRIQIGEIVGQVTQISFRSTVIVTNDNIDVIIPNSDFITGKITNWTQTNRQVRFSVALGVSYDANPDEVCEILRDIACKEEGILAQPAPDVLFEAFGDSALLFRLRYWTETYTDQPAVLQSRLNREILLRLRTAGIGIPFPQRVVHLDYPRPIPPDLGEAS
jgi:small-conductance mechanosensitive channel